MDNRESLSLEALLTQAAGGTADTPSATDPATPETETETEPTTTETEPGTTEETEPETPETTTETEPEDKSAKKPNAIKDLRDRYNSEKSQREKIDNAITRLSSGDYNFKLKDFMEDGKVNYDNLIKAMDDADTKAKAEHRGITPEIQAEIERIEKEKVELERQKLQVAMDRALTDLQLENGLKGADINNFFKDAMAQKKNPYQWLAQGGTLNDLYSIIYRDKIIQDRIDKAINEAKSKWEAEHNRTNRTPTPNPGAVLKPQVNNGDGLSLDQMLAEAAARKAR